MMELWHSLAEKAGVRLASEQVTRLDRFLDLLLEANQRMNLTRIVDRSAAEAQHIGDSLTVLPFLPPTGGRVADVGSGGGVPGIPLAIVRPDLAFMLLEATQKKARFLVETVASLGLTNVSVLPQRAEIAARGELARSFDVVTARAVGSIEDLVNWCVPLLKPKGRLLAMKGAKAAEELAAAARTLRRNHLRAKTHPVPLPGADHHVVVELRRVQA